MKEKVLEVIEEEVKAQRLKFKGHRCNAGCAYGCPASEPSVIIEILNNIKKKIEGI